MHCLYLTISLCLQVAEQYSKRLRDSIMSWPKSKHISLFAIETVSRALNATLSKEEYANVAAAVCESNLVNYGHIFRIKY